jgi:hypothetical protein
MNREQIIQMAKECGLLDINYEIGEWDIHEVTSFASLVASAEREACAKVCEDSVEYAGDTLAKTIRARGQV